MNIARTRVSSSRRPGQIRLFCPVMGPESHSAMWRVNGYPLRLTVWTDAEWSGLVNPPDDAQQLDCGIWCTLTAD